jgi:hypothetical protein
MSTPLFLFVFILIALFLLVSEYFMLTQPNFITLAVFSGVFICFMTFVVLYRD